MKKRGLLLQWLLLISLNGFSQIQLNSVSQAKELLMGKWNLYEYCVYEANFCKKDTSSSIVFKPLIVDNKIEYIIVERGLVKKRGVICINDSIKVRTSDKITIDNFLFSSDYVLIVSFLDSNHLCLLQNSYQGYAKHYKRDTHYEIKKNLPINCQTE